MSHLLAALNVGKRRVAKAQGAHTYSRVITWRGLTIGIENDIGTMRRGKDVDGKAWETQMTTPYGELVNTLGVDDDSLDCFVLESGLNGFTDVYIIGIVNRGTQKFDEEKVFLGAHSAEEAMRVFDAHYDDAAAYFGYIGSMTAEVFVRRCMEPGQRGKSLIANAETRCKLSQRRIQRARAERDDHVDWMQAMVAKAQGVRQVAKGLSVDDLRGEIAELEAKRQTAETYEVSNNAWDDVPETPLIDYRLGLLRYALKVAETPRDVAKALAIPGPDEDLYIRIWPGKNALDLQNQVIPVDLICKSWGYFEQCGNIDLEHISKTGGKSWREKAAKIEAAGFDPKFGIKMRVQYEIGRPVPGSLRIEEMDENGYVTDFSFVAKIHGGGNEAAQWFRSTLPDIPWKPSVGGQMSEPTSVWMTHSDPRIGIQPRVQEIQVARDFRMNHVAMTLEAVNSHVNTIHVLTPDEVAELLASVPSRAEILPV